MEVKSNYKSYLLPSVLEEMELEYEIISDDGSDFYELFFVKKEIELFFSVVVVIDPKLESLSFLLPEIFTFKNEVLEYKDFYENLNLLNAAAMYGNIFYSSKDEESININFSHSIYINDYDHVVSKNVIGDFLDYISFYIKEIFENLKEWQNV